MTARLVLIPISALVVIALLALGLVAMVPQEVELGTHAAEKHGEAAVEEIRSTFLQGECPAEYYVELYSQKRDTWLYLCFFKDAGKVAMWILTDSMSKCWREVTGFFPRNPIVYIARVILRDGYAVQEGALPISVQIAMAFMRAGK